MLNIFSLILICICSSVVACSASADDVYSVGGTTIKTFPHGLFDSNCFIVQNDGEAVIIDAGVDPSPVAEYVFSNKLYVKAIILTHTHVDHSVTAPNLSELFEAPIVVHVLDTNHKHYYTKEVIKDLLDNGGMAESYLPQLKKFVNTKYDIIISNDTEMRVGREMIKIKNAPGHSAGSLCVMIGDSVLFSGDIFVFGYLGNSDIDTGNEKQFKGTLENFILKFNDDINIFQGHGNRLKLSDVKKTIKDRIERVE